MFATLVVEREPIKLENLPVALLTWTLTAGAVAALVGLVVWLITRVQRRPPPGGNGPDQSSGRMWLGIVLFGLLLGAFPYGMNLLWKALGWPPSQLPIPDVRLRALVDGLNVVAALVLVVILAPMLGNLGRLRLRRIWALARLSFKEAIRRKILWAFSAILVVFLFASWFLPFKPEDQVRNYVRVVYFAMSVLLLLTAGLLAAFSIPADLKTQTMHTIVTKPVERFEIVLGRIVGYVMLMTLVLAVITLFGLIYVARGIDPEARAESYKARVPVFGELQIRQGKQLTEGISVGREWGYRKYIGGGATNETATWSFTGLPGGLADRDSVPCEFSFDIFRTTKGTENRGVFCTFTLTSDRWDPSKRKDYEEERGQILNNPDATVSQRASQEQWDPDKKQAVLLSPLAEKYGYYELMSKEVVDYHTLSFEVPAGLFKSAGTAAGGPARAPLEISVRLESPTQYLGVAKHDLYLLDAERAFWLNFFKGAAGLWFRICVVVSLAVALSTYLSGIISFLLTMFVYLLGLLPDFIKVLAEGNKDAGGGPMESALRLFQGANMMTPLDPTPTVRIAQGTDLMSRAVFWVVYHVIPDVDRYDLTNYVAQGYDISASLLLWDSLLPLAGFLVPCAVVAFYLMRSREIAS